MRPHAAVWLNPSIHRRTMIPGVKQIINLLIYRLTFLLTTKKRRRMMRSYVDEIGIGLGVRYERSVGGRATTLTGRPLLSSTPSSTDRRRYGVPRGAGARGRLSLPDGRRLDEAKPLSAVVGRSGLREEQIDAWDGPGERVLDVLVHRIVLGLLHQRYDAAAPLGSFQSVSPLNRLLTPHLNPKHASSSPVSNTLSQRQC